MQVVYGLNTRGEELEGQLTATKESEEKTRALNSDLQLRVNTFKSKVQMKFDPFHLLKRFLDRK